MSVESFKITAHRQRTMQRDSVFGSVYRWLRLKRYQFEVTIPIYMLTTLEKLVFYFVVSSLMLLFCTMAYLYLPNHVSMIQSRVWYYVKGANVSSTIVGAVRTTKTALSHATAEHVATAATATTGRMLAEL